MTAQKFLYFYVFNFLGFYFKILLVFMYAPKRL